MKKILLCYIFVTIFIYNEAQTFNWVSIYPGYSLNTGISKLIVKKNSIYVFNRNHSTLLRSNNRGENWNLTTLPSDSSYHEYTDMHFVNDSVGYVVGYDGSCYSGIGGSIESIIKKTTDGGLTWQTIKNGLITNSILTHINFFNEHYGMAFGTAKMQTERFVTTDGGATWSYLENFKPDMHQINSSYFSEQEGIAIGYGHYMHIAVTHDEGSTWDTKHFHGTSNATGLKFFNPLNGVIISNDSIFFTNDGASSFYSKIKFPFSKCIKSFVMLNMEKGFFCTNKAIYYTPDGGNSWTLTYTNQNTLVQELQLEENSIFASTCFDNFILKLDISNLMVGISDPVVNDSSINIFPNPANDNIQISSSENNLLGVVIADQLGRVVLRQNLTKTNTIDVSDVKNGVYVVEIITTKGNSTHKLVIQNQ